MLSASTWAEEVGAIVLRNRPVAQVLSFGCHYTSPVLLYPPLHGSLESSDYGHFPCIFLIPKALQVTSIIATVTMVCALSGDLPPSAPTPSPPVAPNGTIKRFLVVKVASVYPYTTVTYVPIAARCRGDKQANHDYRDYHDYLAYHAYHDYQLTASKSYQPIADGCFSKSIPACALGAALKTQPPRPRT